VVRDTITDHPVLSRGEIGSVSLAYRSGASRSTLYPYIQARAVAGQ